MRTSRRPGVSSPRTLAVSLLTVSCLAVAGCSAAAETPPSSASAAPPAAVALAPAAPAAPVQVLDGDCAALAGDAEVSAVLGSAVTAQTGFVDSPSGNAVPTAGGIQCQWAESAAATDGATGASLTTVLVTSAGVETTPDGVECYESSSDAGGALVSACSFSIVSGPLWLSGVAYTPAGTTEADTRAAVAAVSNRVGALPAPVVSGPAAPAWQSDGCADLSARAGLPEVLQSPTLLVDDVDVSGAERPAGTVAALVATGFFGCSWYHDGDTPAGQLNGFNSEALPGGAWAETQVLALPGATVMELAGVDLAVRVPTDEAVTGVAEVLNVFDGANWLQVSGTADAATLAPAAVALVAVLNAG